MSVVIAREVKDPRVPSVTVTQVEVTPDAKQATVFIAILGNNTKPQEERDQEMEDCLEGLTSSAGFLRRHVAGVLDIRHIPNLVFKEDKGLENTLRVHELLKQIEEQRKNNGQS